MTSNNKVDIYSVFPMCESKSPNVYVNNILIKPPNIKITPAHPFTI